MGGLEGCSGGMRIADGWLHGKAFGRKTKMASTTVRFGTGPVRLGPCVSMQVVSPTALRHYITLPSHPISFITFKPC